MYAEIVAFVEILCWCVGTIAIYQVPFLSLCSRQSYSSELNIKQLWALGIGITRRSQTATSPAMPLVEAFYKGY